MNRRLLIHDLKPDIAKAIWGSFPEDMLVFAARNQFAHCIGCFGCWIKTPGQCVIQDDITPLPTIIGSCSELILVSRNCYGGFSPEIKRVLDRCIGNLLPFFEIVNDEMHHKRRYHNDFTLSAYFYGPDISEEEKETARNLIRANDVNLRAKDNYVMFYSDIQQLGEVIA